MLKRVFAFFVAVLPLYVNAQSLKVIGDTVSICGPGVGAVGVKITGGVEPFDYKWSVGQTEQVITPFVANSSDFSVTVTDGNGLTTTAVARINVNTVPNAVFVQPAPVWCKGQYAQLAMRLDGAYPLRFRYTVNGVEQPAVSGITSNSFNFPIAQGGLYQIMEVTDRNGCIATASSSIFVPESDLAMRGAIEDIKCDGSFGGNITVYVSGGAPPYDYLWTGPQVVGNTSELTGLLAGEYYVTVTDNRGCEVSSQFTVAQPPPLIAAIASSQPVNCLTGGSIDLTVSGGRPPYRYLWNNNITVQDPQNIAAGSYTVTITDRSGCETSVTTQVDMNTVKPTASAVVNDLLTCENKAVRIDGSGSDAGPGFIYRWEAEPGFIIDGINTLHPTVNQPGQYKLVVINQQNGCTASITARVAAEKNYPVSNPGPPQTISCIIPNATLIATGSSIGDEFSYHWTAPATGSVLGGVTSLTPIVRGVGNYTLTVTNRINGCSSTASVTVRGDFKVPVVTVAPPDALSCTMTSITLDGSASQPKDSLGFYWVTNNGSFLSSVAGALVSVGSAGDYTLRVTDLRNGCTATRTVAVQRTTNNTSLSVKPARRLTCKNLTVVLDASQSVISGSLSYEWTTDAGHFVSGKNTLTPVVDAPGRYTLLVNNPANSCVLSTSVVVERDVQLPVADAGLPRTLNCANREVLLGNINAVKDPAWTYLWTTGGGNILSGSGDAVAIVNRPGLYELQVTNSENECTSVSSVRVQIDTVAPVVSIADPPALNCQNTSVRLDANVGGNFAVYQYQWSSPASNAIIGGANTLTPLVRAVGLYKLSVVKPSNGCVGHASVIVPGDQNNLRLMLEANGTISCLFRTVRVSAISVDGLLLQYRWNTLDGNILSGSETSSIEVNEPGTYTVTGLNITTGCMVTESILILADRAVPQVTVSDAATIDCKNTPVTLTGNGEGAGSMAYEWSATDGGNILGDPHRPSIQVNMAGNYQLIVTNKDNGCSATGNVLVKPDPGTPFAVLDTPAVITCVNKEVVIDATASSTGPDFTYQWQGPGIVTGSNTLLVAVREAGTYKLTVTGKGGCVASASVTVRKDVTAPPANAGGSDLVLNCAFPQRALEPLNAIAHTYNWSGSGILSGHQTAHPVVQKPGIYYVTVTNAATGCVATDSVRITEDFDYPQADAGPTFQLTCFQTSYTIPASATHGPDITYEWTTIGGHIVSPVYLLNPIIDGAGRYFLKVTNNRNGCTAVSSVQIYQAASMPLAVAGDPAILSCNTPVVQLNGGASTQNSVVVYEWKTEPGGRIVSGDNTLTPRVSEPGIYVLTVTDTVNQCASSSSVLVTQDTFVPAIDAGKPVVLTCWRDTLALAAFNSTNGYFKYFWSSAKGHIVKGDTTLQPTVSQAGTYLLSALNVQNGCIAVDSVVVTKDNTPPDASFRVDHGLSCREKTALLTSFLSADQFDKHYFLWSTSDGRLISANNGLSVMADRPGNYQLIVTNIRNGCRDTSTIAIPIDTLSPVVSAVTDRVLDCRTASIALIGEVLPAGNEYFYQWLSFDGNIAIGANNIQAVATAGGTYALLVQNTRNGCVGSAKVVVQANLQAPYVRINTPEGLQCNRSEVTIDGRNSLQNGRIEHKWITLNGHFTGPTDSVFTRADAPGTYILTAIDRQNGCIGADTVQISSNFILPIAEAGLPFSLTCEVPEDRLWAYASAGPVYSHIWMTNEGRILSGQNTLSPLVDRPGYYYLKVINNSTGCTSMDSVLVVRETSMPDSVSYAIDSITCKQDRAGLVFQQVRGGIAPYLYSLDGGKTFSGQVQYTGLEANLYSIVVQDANGCEHEFTLDIAGAIQPGVMIREELIKARTGDTIYIEAVLPDQYPTGKIDTIIWRASPAAVLGNLSLGDGLHPFVVPQRSSALTVQLISTDGCVASDIVRIEIDNRLYIYVANAFIPESARAQNARLLVSADDERIVKIRNFQIFDRWGSLVFSAHDFQPNDPAAGWDGKVNGRLADPAVFTWYVEVELQNGHTQFFEGTTAVVR